MSFKYINVALLKKYRKNSTAKNRVFSGRRNFLKGMGFGLLAFQPTLKLLAKEVRGDINYCYTKKKLSFHLSKGGVWDIDLKKFSGTPKISLLPDVSDWIIELRNAYFPDTNICLDFKARIYKEFSWRMYISFSELDLVADINFADWLTGKIDIQGADYFAEQLQLSHQNSVDINKLCSITLNHLWDIKLRKENHAVLQFSHKLIPLDELTLSLCNESSKKKYHTNNWEADYTLSFTTNRHADILSGWKLESGVDSLNSPDSVVGDYKIVKGKNRKGELVSILYSDFNQEPEPLFYFHTKRDSDVGNRISLCNPQLAIESSNQQDQFVLLASIANNGEWLYESGNAMLLGSNANTPSFEFRGSNGVIHKVKGSAKVLASHYSLKDAISLPVDYPEQPQVELNFRQLKVQQKKKVLKDAKLGTIKFKQKEIIRLSVLRPEDMLFLQLEYYNFKYIKKDQQSYLEIDNPKKPAAMVVLFPSQHTLEQAFWENNSLPGGEGNESVVLPAQYIRSGKSRLVFSVPSNFEGVPIVMEHLLDWSKFKLKVNYRARIIEPMKIILNKFKTSKETDKLLTLRKSAHIGGLRVVKYSKNRKRRQSIYNATQLSASLPNFVSSQLYAKVNYAALKSFLLEMRKPTDFETSIEAPTRLFISPNQLAAFNHRAKIQLKDHFELPKGNVKNLSYTNPLISSKGELSELWHSRLGVRLKHGGVDVDTLDGLRTIRALWAIDARKELLPKPERNQPFLSALDSWDRHNIVHQTSNFKLNGYQPRPVNAHKLMLSSLGAWIDFDVDFDTPDFHANANLELLEWEHKSTLGRDHYVKIVEAGFLFPFGHAASLVKITERKPDDATRSAANRQRMYIVVREPIVYYEMRDPQNGFIPFPFQSVELLTTKTPDIAAPADIVDLGANRNFWINSGGKEMDFDLLLADQEGEEQKIRIPLIFIGKAVGYDKNLSSQVVNAYNTNSVLTKADLHGQSVAYSPSLIDGDSQFETNEIRYGAQVLENKPSTILKFHPVIKTAKVKVRAIEELTGEPDPVLIELRDDNNAGKVFAKVVGNLKADFSGGSDKSGGFISPNIQVSSLSKLKGPLGGDVDKLENLDFDPTEFFASAGDMPIAKLFGVISVFDLLLGNLNFGAEGNQQASIIESIGSEMESLKEDLFEQKAILESAEEDAKAAIQQEIDSIKSQLTDKLNQLEQQLTDQIPRIPNFNTYRTDKAFVVEYRWIPEMEASKSLFGGFLTVDVTNPQEALQVISKLSRPFDTSKKTEFSVDASFTNFSVEIKELIKVSFESLKFGGGSGKKADVKVVMAEEDSILFLGPLSFVNQLQNLIPSNGFSDGPYMKLSPTGVKAGFDLAIPSVEVGVCTIANMTLGAGVHLPFTGAPLTLSFNFCKREAPFLLTVSAFGGGGYFLMKTSVKGFVGMEAAFEFGAALSMNFGVASGGVSVMGGFYFSMEIVDDHTETVLTGYIRINGYLSVLGIISLSVEIYLAFVAMFQNGKVEKLYGEAKVKIKVEVLFFSKTVTLTARRELKGADADPTFQMIMEENDWLEYCEAYA